MKTKLYIVLICAMVLSGFSAKSQVTGNRDHKAGREVNNYNNSGDYDFYYSSRISRFHRSYSTFTYYSPVYTDSYCYSYQPYTWGMSIYGGQAGFGYDAGYPVYNSYSWSSPYYGNSYYWGYTPNYIGWYSPLVITVNSRNWWPHSTYSWHGNSHYYDYSYSNHNYYNNQGYTNSYRRGEPESASTNTYNNTHNNNNNHTNNYSNNYNNNYNNNINDNGNNVSNNNNSQGGNSGNRRGSYQNPRVNGVYNSVTNRNNNSFFPGITKPNTTTNPYMGTNGQSLRQSFNSRTNNAGSTISNIRPGSGGVKSSGSTTVSGNKSSVNKGSASKTKSGSSKDNSSSGDKGIR